MIDNLDVFQEIIISLAKSNGIDISELIHGVDSDSGDVYWGVDYSSSLNDDIQSSINNMLKYFTVHKVAMYEGDMVAAKASLIHAVVFSRSLVSYFQSISDDSYKVINDDKRFNWPEIPDDYQLPRKYLKEWE